MSETFHHQKVTKSRKQRICDWCGQYIDIAHPYESWGWRDGSDSGYCCMHPECVTAMQDIAAKEGGWFTWTAGDFHRGCGCQSGLCECAEAIKCE